MKYLIFFIVLFTWTSAFASDEYIHYNANQIVKFEVSLVPRNIDIYVDFDGDGEADHIFVSPLIEGHAISKMDQDSYFVEYQEFFSLVTDDENQPYKYIVSRSYIFHRKVGSNQYDFAIETRTNDFIVEEYEYIEKPDLLNWFENQMKRE